MSAHLAHGRLGAVVAVLLLAACERGFTEPPHLRQLERLLTGADAGATLFGSADGPAAFAEVWAARIAADGSRVVALDAYPPYLRLFGTDGTFLGGLVRRGEGPSEAMRPDQLALATDTAVLFDVFDGTTPVLVDLSTRAVRRLAPLNLTVRGFDRSCAGEWLVYGAIPGQSPPQRVHFLGFDTVAVVRRSAHQDTSRLALVGGRGPAVVAGESGAMIRQSRREHDDLLVVDCAGAAVEPAWAWGISTLPSRVLRRGNPEHLADGELLMVEVDPTVPWPMGASPVGAELLWLEMRALPWPEHRPPPAEPELRTYFYLIGADGVRAGYVDGFYQLADVRGGHVLLVSYGDYPRLVLLALATLRDALEPGAWRARTPPSGS